MNAATETFVYFMAPIGGGRIKIGISEDPARRLCSLNACSPLKLELLAFAAGSVADERRIQFRFRAGHSHGEWFEASAELLSLIEQVRVGGRLPVDLPAPDSVTWTCRSGRRGRPFSPERRERHAAAMRFTAAVRQRIFELACEAGRHGSQNPYAAAKRALSTQFCLLDDFRAAGGPKPRHSVRQGTPPQPDDSRPAASRLSREARA